MAARKWTIEQRAKQAEKIRDWQPWRHSTGARTPEGKARVAQNGQGKKQQYSRWLNSILHKIKTGAPIDINEFLNMK
jgi:hypothetical protein